MGWVCGGGNLGEICCKLWELFLRIWLYASIMKTKHFLSHWSAVRFLRVPFIEAHFAEEISGLETEVTVFSANHRFTKRGFKVHCCLLKDSEKVQRIIGGVAVVSPEHAYLQVCHELGIQRSILLANLFCSAPDGGRPLTTVSKLRRHINDMHHHRGRLVALRALNYACDGCRSPMEALTHMLISMSNLLGGLGVGKPVFNYEILLPASVSSYAGENFYADICYPEHKLIIEYDGAYHLGTCDADLRRTTILETLGYTVIHITKHELYNLKEFRKVVHRILDILGTRIRLRTDEFQKMLTSLHDLFPRIEDPVNPPLHYWRYRAHEIQEFVDTVCRKRL